MATDIAEDYAAGITAGKDAALLERYSAMAAKAPSPAAAVAPTPAAPAPAATDDAGVIETGMKHLSEIPTQFLFGSVDAVKEVGQKVGLGESENTGWEPETFTGAISRAAGQFAPGFAAASAALSALPVSLAGAGMVAVAAKARPVVAGILAGTLDFDHNEPRVSNLINDMGLGNPLTEFLAADPNDGVAYGTFKSAIENAGFGVATEGVIALARMNRARIGAKRALEQAGARSPEQVADDASRIARDALDPAVDRARAMGGDPKGDAVQFQDAAERLVDAEGRAASVTPGDVAGAAGSAEDRRIAAMSLDEWLASRPAAEAGADPTVESVLRMTGIDAAEKGAPGVSRVDVAGDEVAYLFRDDDGVVRGALHGFLDKNGAPELASVAVSPEFQKKGIGRQLLGAARKDFPNADAAAVQQMAGLTEAGARLRYRDAVEATTRPAQKVYLNLARIDTPDDIKGAIDTLASRDVDAINAARGGETQTFAEVEKLADQLGLDATAVLDRRRGPMGAAEAVAARKLLTSSGEQLMDFARKAGAAEATPADLAAFQKATAVHYALQTEVIAARTETARALASWRIPAGAGGELRLSDLDAALQSAGGADRVREIAARMAMMADNPAAAAKFTRDGFRTGWKGRAFRQLWFNGLLSSPRTHLANITDNALTALGAVPERLSTAATSHAFGTGEVGFREAEALLWGMMRGAREGVKVAGKAFRTGEGSDLFTKIEANAPRAISADAMGLDPGSAIGHGINAVGAALDVPSRGLLAADEFFKAVNYRGELNALAYRQARGEGLSGRSLAERMAQIIDDPPDSLMEQSLEFGRQNTYTNKLGPIASKIAELRDSVNIAGVPVGHFIAPFVRTPANIFRYSFERTPLAPLSRSVRDDIAAGGVRAQAALGRIGIGTTAMLAVADMAAHGQVVGGGPGEPGLRAARERMGIPTYSVKIGDQWVSFERLGYVGTLMGLAADAAELVGWSDVKDEEKTIASTALLFAKSLSNKSYLQGVFQLASIIGEPENDRQASNYVQRIASSLVPFSGIIGSAKNAADPTQRETQDVEASFIRETINRIRSRTPGLSESLPPSRDLWGRPKSYSSNLGVAYDFAIPFRVSEEKPDPVDRTIIENGISVDMPRRAIDGVPLSGAEYSEYVLRAGTKAKEELDRRVAAPNWQILSGGPDGMKAAVVKGIIEKGREAARGEMIREFPELKARIVAADQAKRDLMIGVPR